VLAYTPDGQAVQIIIEIASEEKQSTASTACLQAVRVEQIEKFGFADSKIVSGFSGSKAAFLGRIRLIEL
jgi:hypothetical protein